MPERQGERPAYFEEDTLDPFRMMMIPNSQTGPRLGDGHDKRVMGISDWEKNNNNNDNNNNTT